MGVVCVKLGGSRSSKFRITSGVPQGSIVGPLIFVLFVNDLCQRLKAGKLLYADDLKIFKVIKTVVDCCALQADIDEIHNWCRENGMEVNVRKSKAISFTRCRAKVNFEYKIAGNVFERVEIIRDLGVTMDSKLRFNAHISSTTAKAFAVLGFIRRNTNTFDDVYALKSLYCALVRSILEYAVPVWAPFHVTQIFRLERVQRCFMRYALRRLPWNDPINLPDYSNRCRLIGLQLLSTRRIELQRLLIFDILTNRIDCSALLQSLRLNAPQRRLRNPSFLLEPLHRTTYGYNNPFTVCTRAFNQVYEAFDFNISKKCFKNRIRNLD